MNFTDYLNEANYKPIKTDKELKSAINKMLKLRDTLAVVTATVAVPQAYFDNVVKLLKFIEFGDYSFNGKTVLEDDALVIRYSIPSLSYNGEISIKVNKGAKSTYLLNSSKRGETSVGFVGDTDLVSVIRDDIDNILDN